MAIILNLPTYSMEDVSKHAVEKDAWMVIEGFVHDITDFLVEHPGGKDILMDHLGKDSTDAFNSEQIHAHGTAAFHMLARYPVINEDSNIFHVGGMK